MLTVGIAARTRGSVVGANDSVRRESLRRHWPRPGWAGRWQHPDRARHGAWEMTCLSTLTTCLPVPKHGCRDGPGWTWCMCIIRDE
jgi:hypothetical protein